MPRAKTLLLVTQTKTTQPGRLGDKLKARGYRLEMRCPLEGDSLPNAMNGYAGAVVLGGSMSANDDLPGLRAQLNWIPDALASGKPFLGICLGAQLLARALDAQVTPHPQGLAEVGYFPIQPTVAGAELFETPLYVYHWHREGFEVPREAALLARGERFPNQAFRYGNNAYGVQFHPEMTAAIMENWLERTTEPLPDGAQSAEQQRAGWARFDSALERWLERFLDIWLEG